MDAQTKASILHGTVRQLMAGGKDLTPADWQAFVAAQNDDLRTGPAVGEKIPEFTLPDHNGRPRSLADLSDPNGLLLVFTRSADW